MISIINSLFTIYYWLIIIRIFLSWAPDMSHNEFVEQLYKITDPYLNLFRKVIPPIGMIDVSPIVAIFVLEAIKRLLLLILISI